LKLKNPSYKIHKDRLKLPVAVEQKDELVLKATKSIMQQCQSAGVELIEAQGYLVDENLIEAGERKIGAKYVVMGTGSYPFIPPGIEYDKTCVITSDEVLNLREFPKSIAIYGSGAIGLEMAGFFAANGVDTTLIYRHGHISNKIHPLLVEAIEKELSKNGVKLMPDTSIVEAAEHERRARVVTNKDIYEFDALLVATGRVPDTEVVKCDKIEVSKGIVCDDFFETALKNHFAVGDCNGKLQLAHAARAQVLNVVDNIAGKKRRLNLNNIPRFIYTLPLQYASVGIKGDKEAYFPLSAMALPHLTEAASGGVVVYADEEGFLTGAEIYSPHAEEIVGSVTTALSGEMDVESFLRTVFPHPTYSEAIDRALRRLLRDLK